MTTASDIITVKDRTFEGTLQTIFAAHDVIDGLPSYQFHILVENSSAKEMYQPKQMVEVYAPGTSLTVVTASSASIHHFPMETSKSVVPIASSAVHPASCKETENTAHGEAQHAKKQQQITRILS